MADQPTAFTGAISTHYHDGLGPMFFEPYAIDLAQRVHVGKSADVLELGAGTGIATRRVLQVLPQDARYAVTDLSADMLDRAREWVGADPRIEWQPVDATAIPFADGRFDTVLCQFGWMFFPDKRRAFQEARRVLAPAGSLIFSVWTGLADNPIARFTHEVIGTLFHENAPQFYNIPFGFHDVAVIEGMLRDAGFIAVRRDTVDLIGQSVSAVHAARGLVLGTPVSAAITERGSIATDVVVHSVASRLAAEGGAAPMRLPMRALVFTASTAR